MKMLFILFLGVGLFFGAGYRLHPENTNYYLKMDSSAQQHEVTFADGSTLVGSVEEDTDDVLTLNVDGASLPFKKAEVVTMKAVGGRNFMETLKHNYEVHHIAHPLLTQRKEDSAMNTFNYFLDTPNRLAGVIKKKNPGLSATDEAAQIQKQLAQQKMAQIKKMKEMQKAAEGG